MVNQAEKTALLTLFLQARQAERALVFSRTKHGADKIVRHARGGRHRRQRDPRQQEPGRSASARSPSSSRARCRCWSRPTSPRAGSTSRASATSSTTTCPKCPSNMSTASAAPRAPAPTGKAIAFCAPDERGLLRDIERLTRQKIDVAPLPADFAADGRGAQAAQAGARSRSQRAAQRPRQPAMAKADRRADGQRRAESQRRPAARIRTARDGHGRPIAAAQRRPQRASASAASSRRAASASAAGRSGIRAAERPLQRPAQPQSTVPRPPRTRPPARIAHRPHG